MNYCIAGKLGWHCSGWIDYFRVLGILNLAIHWLRHVLARLKTPRTHTLPSMCIHILNHWQF